MAKIEGKEWILKLVLLGDTAVGKTSLVNQYIHSTFKEDYKSTLGVNIVKKTIKLEKIKSKVRLILWDIAGQDKYEKSRRAYYEGCVGALLVYDMTRFSSFENIEIKWHKDFKEYLKKKGSYIMIGNKNDLDDERGVSKDDALDMAKRIKALDYIETSAKDGSNVEDAFLKLVRHVLVKKGEKFEI